MVPRKGEKDDAQLRSTVRVEPALQAEDTVASLIIKLRGQDSNKSIWFWRMLKNYLVGHTCYTCNICFTARNLDACLPLAPRDPAPLLLSPAQARLKLRLRSLLSLLTPAEAPVAEPRPFPLRSSVQIINF